MVDEKGAVKYIKYDSEYNIYWSKTQGNLRSWDIWQKLECFLKNRFSLAYDFGRDYQLFEKGFNNYAHEIEIGYNKEEWSETAVGYEFGKNFDLGYWMATVETRFKLHEKLSVEYEFRRLQFNPDPDNESTWLGIGTLNFQFTPDLFLRLFTQYRSATERLYVYGLFGWRFKVPNSAFYLVYTRDDFNSGPTEKLDYPLVVRNRNEIFFVKFAYDFVL